MKARQSSVSITYDGKAGRSVLDLNKTAFTYTDPASGEADSLDITFFERSASAVSGGKVEVNKPLSATIVLTNWAAQAETTAASTAATSLLTAFHIQAGRGQVP